jgi:hypothetical protein
MRSGGIQSNSDVSAPPGLISQLFNSFFPCKSKKPRGTAPFVRLRLDRRRQKPTHQGAG